MRASLWLAAALVVTGCSSKSLMQPDCHSCTVEDQAWDEFSWNALSGQWKGSVETLRSEKGQKKVKQETKVDFRFLPAADFLKAKGSPACASLPGNALVLNGLLWNSSSGRSEFEAFVPADEKVAYGRLSFEKMNGQSICHFRRLGRVMGKNRLALPTVAFSENSTFSGRQVASTGVESEVFLEFLRFVPVEVKPVPFKSDGRRPSSVAVEEKPPLMIRVFKLSSRDKGARGEWSGSEEQLYRLWKAE